MTLRARSCAYADRMNCRCPAWLAVAGVLAAACAGAPAPPVTTAPETVAPAESAAPPLLVGPVGSGAPGVSASAPSAAPPVAIRFEEDPSGSRAVSVVIDSLKFRSVVGSGKTPSLCALTRHTGGKTRAAGQIIRPSTLLECPSGGARIERVGDVLWVRGPDEPHSFQLVPGAILEAPLVIRRAQSCPASASARPVDFYVERVAVKQPGEPRSAEVRVRVPALGLVVARYDWLLTDDCSSTSFAKGRALGASCRIGLTTVSHHLRELDGVVELASSRHSADDPPGLDRIDSVEAIALPCGAQARFHGPTETPRRNPTCWQRCEGAQERCTAACLFEHANLDGELDEPGRVCRDACAAPRDACRKRC
jgi:hypothetical protein